MLVRFLKRWRNYQPGEVAGFEPDIAETLIAGGVATAGDVAANSAVAKKGKAKADAAEAEAKAKAEADAAEAEAKAKAEADADKGNAA